MGRERFVFYADWRAWALPLYVAVDRYTSTITVAVLCLHMHFDLRSDETVSTQHQPGDL